MKDNPDSPNQNSTGLTLLNWLGIIFCFAVFPMLLIIGGLENLNEIKTQNQKMRAEERLNDVLDLLSPFCEERFYVHSILKRTFSNAEKSKNPISFLKKALNRLKHNYPGAFTFVVWDSSGEVIPSLTDQNGFGYVLKKLWEVIKAINENYYSSKPVPILQIPEIENKIKIMKPFLGPQFLPNQLEFPYQSSPPPSLLLVGIPEQRRFIWHHYGKKISLFCFVHRKMEEGRNGLKKIISAFNRRHYGNINAGFVDTTFLDRHFPEKFPTFSNEVLIGLGRFNNSAEAFVETSNLLLAGRVLGEDLRIFTYQPRMQYLKGIKEKFDILVGAIFCFFIPAIIFTYFLMILRRRIFFSIRWELIFLFLYASGIPLLVLAFLGYDYLQSRRMGMLREFQLRGKELIENFDQRFPIIRDETKDKIGDYLTQLRKTTNGRPPSVSEMSECYKFIEAFEPDEVVIVASSSGRMLPDKKEKLSKSHSQKFMTQIGINILNFMNREKVDYSFLPREASPEAIDDSQSEVYIEKGINSLGKMVVLNFGRERKWVWMDCIGDPERRFNHYFVFLTWEQTRFQEMFVERILPQTRLNPFQIMLFARSITTGRNLGSKVIPEKPLQILFSKVTGRHQIFIRTLKQSNESFAGIGMTGENLSSIALVGLFPHFLIEKAILSLALQLIAFVILSLFLAFGIGILLSRQFLLPIRALGEGAKAISNLNFRNRISDLAQDELGQLGTVLNRVMESLNELQVGRVVQENLFPNGPLVREHVRIFGKNISMTELGGDYFDYFQLDNGNIVVIMGDVAGHGVGAALVMALAKACVLLNGEFHNEPQQVLQKIHDTLRAVQKKQSKKMMTIQYLVIDPVTGQGLFANAGHCFPLMINTQKQTSNYLELPGMPVGITKKARFSQCEINLGFGEAIVLYTDGIIESSNANGEMMGYPGFQKLALKSFNPDPEKFYDNIYLKYKEWAELANDDVTMVLITFSPKIDLPAPPKEHA